MLKGLRLNLACGEDRKPGFLGVDQIQSEGVDIVWDLNKYPLPFDDNSVDEIICNHFIEHADDLVKFMEELYRIMKPGSSGIITAPYWSHVNAWIRPTREASATRPYSSLMKAGGKPTERPFMESRRTLMWGSGLKSTRSL
jgi:SAM-dependent methyltransferase